MKLLASMHTPQELEYLVKTAKAVGLDCIVVVASKSQLIDVIENVQGISIISVTNRNHFLWKIDRGKASRICNHPEVANILKSWLAGDENRILIEEGFCCKEDMEAVNREDVDCTLIGEELLLGKEEWSNEEFGNSIDMWLS